MNKPDSLQEAIVKRKAWIMFAVLALPYLLVYFHRVAPAVIADDLMADFNLSGAVLGNLAAIYFYVYTVMQVPAGVIADSLGSRKTVVAGMIISGLGTFVFSWSPYLAFAYFGRLLIGLGVSVIFVAFLKILSEWFYTHQFGFVSGLTLLIGNTGAMIAATPLAFSVAHWGWRMSFAVVGAISILAALLTLLFVRDRPEYVGLPSPNFAAGSRKKMTLSSIREGLKYVIANPHSWPPFFIFFGIYGSLMAFQGVWGVPYLMQHYGMERIDAASRLLFMAFGLAAGSPFAGLISDRLRSRKKPLLGFSTGFILCWIALIFWPGGKPPVGSLSVLFFVMGFSSAGFILIWACAKEVNPTAMSGSAMGLANMGGALGAAIVQPLFGWALDQKWDGVMHSGIRIYSLEAFRFAFIIQLIILILASLFVFVMRESYGGFDE